MLWHKLLLLLMDDGQTTSTRVSDGVAPSSSLSLVPAHARTIVQTPQLQFLPRPFIGVEIISRFHTSLRWLPETHLPAYVDDEASHSICTLRLCWEDGLGVCGHGVGCG